jgi:hypothetical protein
MALSVNILAILVFAGMYTMAGDEEAVVITAVVVVILTAAAFPMEVGAEVTGFCSACLTFIEI